MKATTLLVGILFLFSGLRAQITCYGSGTDSITFITSYTDPICFGSCDGTAVLSVLAGSGNYTYSWTGPNISVPITTTSAVNLCAGTYTLVVTDVTFGISCSGTITLTDPPQLFGNLVSSTSPTPSNCNGVLTYSVSGGSGPYSYQLVDCTTMSPVGSPQTSSTFSGLCAGSYAAQIIDANGCMVTTSCYTLCEILVAESITGISCAGMCDATIVLTTTASNPSFAWSNGTTGSTLTGLCAGSYCVTVTDGVTGCQFDTCYVIDPEVLITPTVVNTTDVTCFGDCDGSAVMNATGGTGITAYSLDQGASWQPFPNFYNLCPGVYEGYAQDSSGCMGGPISFVINEPPALILSVDSIHHASGPGINDGAVYITVSGGVPAYTITFDGSSIGAGPIQNVSPGSHQICVTDANGCMICDTVVVSFLAGIGLADLSKTRLYPNPSSGTFSLELPDNISGKCQVEIYDAIQKTIFSREFIAQKKLHVDLGDITTGYYMVQLIYEGQRYMLRLSVR